MIEAHIARERAEEYNYKQSNEYKLTTVIEELINDYSSRGFFECEVELSECVTQTDTGIIIHSLQQLGYEAYVKQQSYFDFRTNSILVIKW